MRGRHLRVDAVERRAGDGAPVGRHRRHDSRSDDGRRGHRDRRRGPAPRAGESPGVAPVRRGCAAVGDVRPVAALRRATDRIGHERRRQHHGRGRRAPAVRRRRHRRARRRAVGRIERVVRDAAARRAAAPRMVRSRSAICRTRRARGRRPGRSRRRRAASRDNRFKPIAISRACRRRVRRAGFPAPARKGPRCSRSCTTSRRARSSRSRTPTPTSPSIRPSTSSPRPTTSSSTIWDSSGSRTTARVRCRRTRPAR